MILSCLFFLFLIFFPIDFCYFDVKCHGWVFVLPMCCQIVLFTVHASRRLKKKKVQCLERSRVKSWKHFLMKKETSLQLTFFFPSSMPRPDYTSGEQLTWKAVDKKLPILPSNSNVSRQHHLLFEPDKLISSTRNWPDPVFLSFSFVNLTSRLALQIIF